MAKQTIVTDDLTQETENVSTYFYAFDGSWYEIDLTEKNYETFRKHMSKYTTASRETTPTRAHANGGISQNRSRTSDADAIREWARVHGHKVSDRGRLPDDVIEAYDKAQKEASK